MSWATNRVQDQRKMEGGIMMVCRLFLVESPVDFRGPPLEEKDNYAVLEHRGVRKKP